MNDSNRVRVESRKVKSLDSAIRMYSKLLNSVVGDYCQPDDTIETNEHLTEPKSKKSVL
jgi:hypothetical protein